MSVFLLLLACADKPPADTAADAPAGETLLFTTVSDDYAVGALATLSTADLTLSDNLTATTGDAYVRADAGLAIQINAYGYDAVRLYDLGDWAAPQVEFSVGAGANPHDGERCGDALFISLYEEDQLAIFDPSSGLRTGSIDLSAYDDGDGIPEASDLIELNGRLYLALHQLARDAGWVADGGTVVEIDCSTRAITRDWAVGPNPTLTAATDTALLVRTGVYYDADYNLLLDGALSLLDTETGAQSPPLLSEVAIGYNIDSAVAIGDHALAILSDESNRYRLGCLTLSTGALTLVEETDAYLFTMTTTPSGEAWIGARSGYAHPEVPGGLFAYDLATCTSRLGDDWIRPTLSPYDLSVY